jgi:hypothetical protein
LKYEVAGGGKKIFKNTPTLDYIIIFAPSLNAWREDAWRMHPLPQAEGSAFAGAGHLSKTK